MRRRAFLGILGGAAIAFPLTTLAQTAKVPRVGVLWHAGNEQEEAIYLGAFRKGLNELGYVEGKNIELVNRFADEHYDRFEGLAAELVNAKVDVMVASIGYAAAAAKRITTTIPIVAAYGGDYVASGLAKSLSHPGGNVTGLSAIFEDLGGKQVEILKDCFGELSAVALLFNAASSLRAYISEVQKTADSLRVSLHVVEVQSPSHLDPGFSAIANSHAKAVMLTPDGMFYNERKRIAELSVAHSLPTIAWNLELAEAGALMSYGADARDLFRRAAGYVDKTFKGANPADMPIEQPTKLELVINLKTAKSINVTIPSTVLFRADKVIE